MAKIDTSAILRARFAREYAVDGVGVAAMRRADPLDRRPAATAAKLLADPSVRALVQQHMQAAMAREGITEHAVLGELAAVALGKITDVAGWASGGVLIRDSCDLTPLQAAAIQSIETDKATGQIKIKMHDKIKALELLGKYLTLWQPRLPESSATDAAAAFRELIDAMPE